jgi:uncharacterized protein
VFLRLWDPVAAAKLASEPMTSRALPLAAMKIVPMNKQYATTDHLHLRRTVLAGAALLLVPLSGGCEMRVVGETAQDYFGDTPQAKLARAAAEGRVDEVHQLVKQGALVNAAGKQNMTPLVWAMTANNLSGMQALLEAGADPNQRIGPQKELHPVWIAARDAPSEQLALLLKYKGDPNAPHNDGHYAPLPRAMLNLVNVKLLVEAGANVNIANSLGSPFVLGAASLAQYDVVLYMLDQGFNRNLPLLAWEINDRRPDGKAPLPPELEPKRLQVAQRLKQMGVITPDKPPPLSKD